MNKYSTPKYIPTYLSNVFTNYFQHDAITGELAASRRAKFYVASNCTLVIVRIILWNRREHFVNNVKTSKRTFPCWRLSWWFPTLFACPWLSLYFLLCVGYISRMFLYNCYPPICSLLELGFQLEHQEWFDKLLIITFNLLLIIFVFEHKEHIQTYKKRLSRIVWVKTC